MHALAPLLLVVSLDVAARPDAQEDDARTDEAAAPEEPARGRGLVRRAGLVYMRVAPGFLGVRLDGPGGAGYTYGVGAGGARMMRERGFSYMIGGRFTHRFSRIAIADGALDELQHWFHVGVEFRPGFRQRRLFAFGLLTPSLVIQRRTGDPARRDGTHVGAGIGAGAGVIGWVTELLFIGTEVEFLFDGFFATEGGVPDSPWTQQFQWFVMFGWAF